MADENDMTSAEDQALADEWAAALGEAGDSQADIDALLAADAGNSGSRMTMEEFGSVPKSAGPVTLDGPNLDVILDIPVSISMEVGSTDINIRNLLQLNQGSVIELDRLAGEPLDVLVNG
ncbi:flagellar motor switch protein FliN, partial [Pseudomonas syringae pv. actinidiae]|nr:flagellar motor switch protein FliN [Pseudomonas syringae pv. actinidifoliorum]NVL43928.1 flagellar motor switch protein FliN [Pseudomonas syringae pv. actinidiae]